MKLQKEDILWYSTVFLACVLMAFLLTACTPDTQDGTQGTPSLSSPTDTSSDPTDSSSEPSNPPAVLPSPKPPVNPPTEPPQPPTVPPTEPPSIPTTFEGIFTSRYSWHNYALISIFSDPSEVNFADLFARNYNGKEYTLSEEERDLLEGRLNLIGTPRILCYTEEEINKILSTCFGLSIEDMNTNIEDYFVYLEQTNRYYSVYRGSPGIPLQDVRIVECDDGTSNLYYTYGTSRVAKVRVVGNNYYILSNEYYTEAPPLSGELTDMQTLFDDRYQYFQAAANCHFTSPTELNLSTVFYYGFPDETQVTPEERHALISLEPMFEYGDTYRLPKDKMNTVLLQWFGITLQDVPASGFKNLTYLEGTGCYYIAVSDPLAIRPELNAMETNVDGTISITFRDDELAEYRMTLRKNGESYQILSNIRTTEVVEPAPYLPMSAYQNLLQNPASWYNRALCCQFNEPKELVLKELFYYGFDGEHTPTDEERAALADRLNFDIEFHRLPKAKMDEVLSLYFGITVDQMPAAAFAGLTYLESTDCYYFCASDFNSVEPVVSSVKTDGTLVHVRYNNDKFVLTLEYKNGGYLIRSHVSA